MILCCRSSVSR